MATLVTSSARAYMNWSRWVADCPMDCGGAMALEPGQSAFFCQECKHITSVDWPDNADDIMDALAERPMPRTRNWYPEQHDLALRFNLPHGQTPKQLREEARENGVDNS